MKTTTKAVVELMKQMPYGEAVMAVELGTDYSMGGIEYFGVITQYSAHPVYGDAHHVLIVNVHNAGQPNQCLGKVRGTIEGTFTDAKRALFSMLCEEMEGTAWDEESRRD